MPFKSKAQQRFMFAAEERGEIPKGTAERWADHTPNIKDLPEKKKKKKDSKEEKDVKKAALRCLVGRLQKTAGLKKIMGHLKKANPMAARAPQASHPGPMQPLQAAQPSGAAMTPRRCDDIAKGISRFGSTERGRAAYERLAQYRRGAVKGYAAASQPDAKGRFREALGGGAKTASTERLGTPYMDGFFTYCLQQKMNGDQVADMLEKAAEEPGRLGEEAQAMIDRMQQA